jgi:membrane protease YdiL (CAAX protease family)
LRVPAPLAWQLLLLTFFTAGLLRQFHDRTPRSPYVPATVGSLLFAAIFFLLLVAAWEWRRGAVPGHGIRLGSLTPIMLMLLIEKWISLTLYGPLFNWISPLTARAEMLDAQFIALAGGGLVMVCLLVCWFSAPAARKCWRRARPARWLTAIVATILVVSATYLLLGAAAWALGGSLKLKWPDPGPLFFWIIGGQLLLAFGEELYYRGLLLNEMERLAPRLGARSPVTRRWIALLATSALFGMEHLRLDPFSLEQVGRQMIFTVSFGLLLGLLIMVSTNIVFGAGIHAWINWLLLGAAPYFVDGAGEAALPAGTYIGLTMILAFAWSYLYQRLRRRHRLRAIIS